MPSFPIESRSPQAMSQESIFFLDELVDVDELFELLPDVDTISPALPPPAPRTQVNRSDQPIWLVASPPPTNKSRCKRTTTKRKDEIEQLRRQVSELKIQLACTPILGSLEAPSEGTASYLWMNLSQRQENERRRAEEENGRLRQALAEQNKLIQSLRRVARTSKVNAFEQDQLLYLNHLMRGFVRTTGVEASCIELQILVDDQ